MKRRKAETKLIKLRIIKKLYEQQSLSKLETEYLKRWREGVKSSSLNGKSGLKLFIYFSDIDLVMVPKDYSKRVVGTISQKDQNQFRSLDFFNLGAVENLVLNDLILEISLFYDDAIISRVHK